MRPTLVSASLLLGLALVCASPLAAQEAMQQSPITPGFWAWPREKLTTPEQIARSCSTRFAVQFADGRYFGVTARTATKPVSPPEIHEVGQCRFDAARQVERCELRAPQADGSTVSGVIESRFSRDADGAVKMTVTPRATQGGDGAKQPEPFEVFPVRCPDDVVWATLNGEAPK